MATLTISAENEKRVKAMGFLSNKGTDNFSGRIITVNGKITAKQMECISKAAQIYGNGVVTFTTRLTVEVQGIPYEKIDAEENQKLTKQYKVMLAPTLIVTDEQDYQAYANASNIRKFIDAQK